MHRSTVSPLLVARVTRSMAEPMPDEAQEGRRAHEMWVTDELRAAAAATPLLDVEWTDRAHDVQVQAPEPLVRMLDDRPAAARAPG